MKNQTDKTVEEIHVRCIAHIVNLAVKDCFTLIHDKIQQVRSLVSAINSSVKRRDLFENARKTLKLSVSVPGLDCETRWSSTFTMVKDAYDAKRVLNFITSTSEDLRSYSMKISIGMIVLRCVNFSKMPRL